MKEERYAGTDQQALRAAELPDEALNAVNGGLDTDTIVRLINQHWQMVPEEIRNQIIDTLIRMGKPAARKRAARLFASEKMDWAMPMIDLIQ